MPVKNLKRIHCDLVAVDYEKLNDISLASKTPRTALVRACVEYMLNNEQLRKEICKELSKKSKHQKS